MLVMFCNKNISSESAQMVRLSLVAHCSENMQVRFVGHSLIILGSVHEDKNKNANDNKTI